MAEVIIRARVNHGRWLGDCPNCGGAEVVHLGRQFTCESRVAAGFHGEAMRCGFTAPVLFPDEKLEIQRILSARPVENRNWTPGETVTDLIRENLAHATKLLKT